MADRIKFRVSAMPIETLTTENNTSKDVLASEVNTVLGGGGDSVDLDGYEDAASGQGYLNGAAYYAEASYSAGGSVIVSNTPKDFVFIKNTGFKYSSSTALGTSTTDCVLVVIEIPDYGDGSQSGWVDDGSDLGVKHYYEIGWLKPGQAIVLPGGAGQMSITQFGATANDFSEIGHANAYGSYRILARTFQSNGSAATTSNAIEFLAVD